MTINYPLAIIPKIERYAEVGESAAIRKSFSRKFVSALTSSRTIKGGAIATGIAAALVTLYNIFTNGPAEGMTNAKKQMGEKYADLFVKANSSQSYSHLGEKIKRFTRGYIFNDSIYPAYAKVKNVVVSTLGEVLNNGLELTAAAGAIAAPLLIGGPVGLGIGVISAGFLAFEGASFFFGDNLGIGKDGL